MLSARALAVLASVFVLPAESEQHWSYADEPSRPPGESARQPASSPDDGPTRMEELADTSPPIYVLRGAHAGNAPIVVLHGVCSHALGYAQSFQWSAAKKGILVAPQGDTRCPGPWASWSLDLAALDARIELAFGALGLAEPLHDVTLIGYSQGSSRAEALARRWPERYTRLVLMSSPDAPSARGLGKLRAAVMMVGERERQDLMKQGLAAFRAAGVPATFQLIPGARHGQMGPNPEATMGAALDWLWEHQRPEADSGD